MGRAFEPVDPKASFPELERADPRVLEGGATSSHARSPSARARPAGSSTRARRPRTARPGVHHVEPRTFKDVYPRFKTMTGHLVPRKGGWDCHGLPVELEVEKEIGTTGQARHRGVRHRRVQPSAAASRSQRYVGEFERLTERIGYWVDLDEAYWTMAPEYVESVWWSLKRSSTRACCRRPTRSRRTARGAAPRCPTPRSPMGYQTRRGPERLRPVPDRRGARREPRRRLAARVDHHAVDAAVEHRRAVDPARRLRGGRARRASG